MKATDTSEPMEHDAAPAAAVLTIKGPNVDAAAVDVDAEGHDDDRSAETAAAPLSGRHA
jgi:hypothetical protein